MRRIDRLSNFNGHEGQVVLTMRVWRHNPGSTELGLAPIIKPSREVKYCNIYYIFLSILRSNKLV